MARPIKILRAITRLNIGGPAIHTILLTAALNDGVEFASTLVAGTTAAREGDMLDLAHVRAVEPVVVPQLGREINPLDDLVALARMVQLIRKIRPDIVHTHMAKAGSVGRLAARICGVPLIVHTYHGHVFHGYFNSARTRIFLTIERALGQLTDRIIVLGDGQRQEIASYGIAPLSKLEPIRLGLELGEFLHAEQSRGEFRRTLRVSANTHEGLCESLDVSANTLGELGRSLDVSASTDAGSRRLIGVSANTPEGLRKSTRVSANTPLVGIVARLVPIKAHEVFFAAAQRVLQSMPATQFLVIGDGERRLELESLVSQLRLAGNVSFLGWRRDMVNVYADLDVVALTSLNEGSPVALIEALAAARPVISTAVGGVPEVVVDGVTGITVPVSDAPALAEGILRLLRDREFAQRLGEAGRRHVYPRYDSSRLVDDVRHLYLRELATRGRIVPSVGATA